MLGACCVGRVFLSEKLPGWKSPTFPFPCRVPRPSDLPHSVYILFTEERRREPLCRRKSISTSWVAVRPSKRNYITNTAPRAAGIGRGVDLWGKGHRSDGWPHNVVPASFLLFLLYYSLLNNISSKATGLSASGGTGNDDDQLCVCGSVGQWISRCSSHQFTEEMKIARPLSVSFVRK